MHKLGKIGFVDIRRGEEFAVGVDECAQYPLFTPDFLALMRRAIPPERQRRVARSVMFLVRKPAAS